MSRVAIVALIVAAACGCRRHHAVAVRPTKPRVTVHVPRAKEALTLDGELSEASWIASARSGPFREGGHEARPYSDARFLRTGDTLYIGLYAADEDIRAPMQAEDAPLWLDDSFHLVFGDGPFETLDISPRGTRTDAKGPRLDRLDYGYSMGAKAATDADGTIDDPSDEDEEWVVELAIPMRSLGVANEVPLSLRRCDRPKNAPRTCGVVDLLLVLDG